MVCYNRLVTITHTATCNHIVWSQTQAIINLLGPSHELWLHRSAADSFMLSWKENESFFSFSASEACTHTQACWNSLNICNFADKKFLGIELLNLALAMKDSKGIKQTAMKLYYRFNKTGSKLVIAPCKSDVNLMLMTIDTHRVMLTQGTPWLWGTTRGLTRDILGLF